MWLLHRPCTLITWTLVLAWPGIAQSSHYSVLRISPVNFTLISTELLKSTMDKVMTDMQDMMKEIVELLKPKVKKVLLVLIILFCQCKSQEYEETREGIRRVISTKYPSSREA